MISKRDSKPFLVKFPVGVVRDSATETQFDSEWNVCYGLIGDPRGSLFRRVYGNEPEFDKVVILNYGSISKKINYDTSFLLDNMPTDTFADGDYSVTSITPPYNNEIVIGLNKKSSINIPKIYFYKNGQLMFVQFNLDSNSNTIYAGKNDIVPFDVGENIWLREPASEEDTSYRYKVSEFNNVGYTKWCKPFLEISLEENFE